ncbi:MAG: response regulator transcription factor [Pseudomonadota bacterium]
MSRVASPARQAAKFGAVLCVDDDPVVQLMLGDIVRMAGGSYMSATSAREAEAQLAQTDFDLILLDRKLPDSDGLLLLQTIKQGCDCPVIVLSAMDETRDKILGLGLGAAEYVTKPFDPAELSGRVRAVLQDRAASRAETDRAPISCGPLEFEPGTRALRIGLQEDFLPPAEARLLHAFLLGQGEPQSRDALTRMTCGRDWTPGDRTVDVLITRLRRRIPKDVARIVTIHRFGYVFTPES